MPVLPIVERLPDEHLRLVGEVITAWAVQEYELRLTVFLLLGLDPKRGRVAVRPARAKETIEMIGDLMNLSGLTSKTTRLPELGKFLDEIETRRNTLAHNIWFKNEQGVYLVQSLSGVWPERAPNGKVKRRLQPAGIPIPTDSLADLIVALRKSIHQTKLLRGELALELQSRGRPAQAAEE